MVKVRNQDRGTRITSEGGTHTEAKEKKKNLRLSVSSFSKRVARSSEKSFEKKFYSALTKCGYPNWHMAVREAGWPDRYAVGGHWFELKSLHALTDESQLSPAQVQHLNMLSRSGDKCYYVAKWEHNVIFVPWAEFKKHLSPAEAVANGHRYAYKDLEEMIRYVVR